MDRRLQPGGDTPHGALRQRLARRATDAGAGRAVVASIRDEAARQGKRIPDDHYGANITYRFGSWDEHEVEQATAASRASPSRIAPDPREHFAVGDAADIIRRIEEYVAVGVTKFVARPIAEGDDALMEQTQRLIKEVLPVVHREDGTGA